jgi:hypothetical protein
MSEHVNNPPNVEFLKDENRFGAVEPVAIVGMGKHV